VFLDGVKLKQEHIQAHRLMLEIVDIQEMPDDFDKSLAFQEWVIKLEKWKERIKPAEPRQGLVLVPPVRRQPLRSCDEITYLT